MVVAQAHVRKREEPTSYYEVLFRNGKVKWYGQSLVGVDLFIYETVDAYLKECKTTLKEWAGTFQHGLLLAGRRRQEEDDDDAAATDEYVSLWRAQYAL